MWRSAYPCEYMLPFGQFFHWWALSDILQLMSRSARGWVVSSTQVVLEH